MGDCSTDLIFFFILHICSKRKKSEKGDLCYEKAISREGGLPEGLTDEEERGEREAMKNESSRDEIVGEREGRMLQDERIECSLADKK